MLGDFFRINLPYGLSKNEDGSWWAFNREYMPIGYNKILPLEDRDFDSLPIHTKYRGLTDNFLLKLVDGNEKNIKRNEKDNSITKIFFYNDETNPMNQKSTNNIYWKIYWKKIEALSKLTEKK
jgi:hypothetical protein